MESSTRVEITGGALSDAEDDLAKLKDKLHRDEVAIEAAQGRVDKFKARLMLLDPFGVGSVYVGDAKIAAIASRLV